MSHFNYSYDGWNLIGDYDASGNELARYIHGTQSDETRHEGNAALDSLRANLHANGGTWLPGRKRCQLLAKISPTVALYYLQDGNGNVTTLTDATGSVQERYTYDVYGTPSITAGAGNVLTISGQGNRFMFTGRELISQIGLYDYRNRVYSPGLGRFLQTDPIRFQAGDINIYRYVGNGPVNWGDASGEKINCDDLDDDEKNRLEEALDKLSKNQDMKDIIDSLRNSDDEFYIHNNNNNNDEFKAEENDINWDSDSWLGTYDNNANLTGGVQSPETGLGHELDHANQHDKNPDQFNKDLHNKDQYYKNKEEKRVITGSETSFAKQNGEATRTNHWGKSFY